MFNTIEECISELHQKVYRRGINYTLADFQSHLSLLNNPQESLRNVVHIAGTNGKGSTVAMLSQALMKEGHSVGTFTSPHIESYLERITLNGETISEPLFCEYFNKVSKAPEFQTEFEVLTVMSLLFFKDTQPDFIIFETGLGGRFDTTNVVTPILSIITKISLDHQEILGDSLVEIAQEKAGIIKTNCPVISINSQEMEVKLILEKEAGLKNTTIKFIKPMEALPQKSALQGEYQKENTALALDAFMTLTSNNSKDTFLNHLQTAKHWGRFTQVSESPLIICDGAHNESAIQALLQSVDSTQPEMTKLFIIGIHKNKRIRPIIDPIILQNHEVVYCPFDDTICASYESIRNEFPNIDQAPIDSLSEIIKNNEDKMIILTGSIYFISKMKPILENYFEREVTR
jgi:dihydrofolate synthase / folylpolyglutamate synthase